MGRGCILLLFLKCMLDFELGSKQVFKWNTLSMRTLPFSEQWGKGMGISKAPHGICSNGGGHLPCCQSWSCSRKCSIANCSSPPPNWYARDVSPSYDLALLSSAREEGTMLVEKELPRWSLKMRMEHNCVWESIFEGNREDHSIMRENFIYNKMFPCCYLCI